MIHSVSNVSFKATPIAQQPEKLPVINCSHPQACDIPAVKPSVDNLQANFMPLLQKVAFQGLLGRSKSETQFIQQTINDIKAAKENGEIKDLKVKEVKDQGYVITFSINDKKYELEDVETTDLGHIHCPTLIKDNDKFSLSVIENGKERIAWIQQKEFDQMKNILDVDYNCLRHDHA